MTEKLKVNMDDLTWRELGEIRKATGIPLAELMGGEDEVTGMAAMIWITKRRTDPTFTLDDALDLRLSETDIVTASPETMGGSNGDTPALSPESGTSTPSP